MMDKKIETNNNIKQKFSIHFEQNIKRKLKSNDSNDQREKIAILCSGCYCPAHIGHYMMMEYAINEVSQKYNFVIGIFSPAYDAYMASKIQDFPIGIEARKTFFLKLIEENNHSKHNVFVDDFEGKQDIFIDYPDLCSLYREELSKLNIKLAYCIGSDLLKYGINLYYKGFADYLIIIERDQYKVPFSVQQNKNLMIIKNTSYKDLTSTTIRKQIVYDEKVGEKLKSQQ